MRSLSLIASMLLVGACQPPPNKTVADGGRGSGAKDSGTIDATSDTCARSWQEESDKWGKCIDREVWDELDMGQIAFQETASGPCYQCHRAGVGGIFLSSDEDETFEKTQVLPFVTGHIAAEYGEDDCLERVVASHRLLDRESAPTSFHPAFQWTAERRQSLLDFFDMTHAAYLAEACQ